MLRMDRRAVVFILVFFISAFVFTQEKQVAPEKQLREKILELYQSTGEQGLRNFVKKDQDNITNTFIVDFAEEGVKGRKKEWLKACKIMAEEKKDEKTLADVLYQTGEYFRLISENKKALDYFEKALPIYIKLSDSVGQGNVYLRKGDIFFITNDNSRALEMYEKALSFFEKAKDPQGQGRVYLRKGINYSVSGDNLKAFEMYDKALTFYEKTKETLGQGSVYKRKGDIYFRIGRNLKAHEMYDKALPFFEKAGNLIGQGNIYIRKGAIYFYTGDNSKSVEMYDKALPFYERTSNIIGLGNVYLKRGEIYLRIGDNSRAFEMYDKSLTFFEKVGNLIGQGNVYHSKGSYFLIIGKNPEAIEMYERALPFYEKAGDLIGQGNVYKSKGNIYMVTGEYSKALEMYERSLPFFEKAGGPISKGNVYWRKGEIYFNIGDNSKALAMIEKALPFFKKAKEPLGQGNVYKLKGKIYLRIGKTSKALDMYDKALPFFEKARQPIGMGNVYLNKGDVYFYTSDNSKAIEMYNKALSFFEKVGQPTCLGNVYLGKGDVYLRIGDNSKALEMYDKALLYFKKAEDTIGLGNIYTRKGDIYLKIGENVTALNMYDNAMSIYEKVGFSIGQGNIYVSKADVYLHTGEYSLALEMLEEALPFFVGSKYLMGQGNINLRKGNFYSRIGNNPSALEMYNKALSFYKKAGAIYPESFALHGKAKIFIKLGKKDEALHLFEKSIKNLEKLRTQTAFSEMKRTFMEKVYKQYKETVLFMLENKYYNKGFKYAETMRARVFLDRMGEGLVPLDKGLKKELREERGKLVKKLSSLSKDIHKTAGKKDEQKLQELKEQYRKVEDEFEELLVNIRLHNPLYASIRYPQPITVQSLQKEILKKGETLLSYFISIEKAYAFIVSREYFKVKQLKVNEKEINGYVERYLHSIKENNANDMKRFGSLLYEKLLKPLEKHLKKSWDIIIVPSGKLETIPFESLIISKKKPGLPVFLMKKYRLKYVQSASILSVLRKHYQRYKETSSFIGFGDPVYDYENFQQGKPEQGIIFSHEDTRRDTNEKRLSSVPSVSSVAIEDEIKEIHRDRYARGGGIMDRLPHSGEEIKTIVRLFEQKSQKCKIHLRDHASEEHAKSPDLKEFDYIHFSCHGLLNDDFQSLVLSQIPGAKDDGYFTLNEIMNCDYNAKLVVLSACQTGSGKMERAEGVTGLTRAVMYAGTPAVLASLWKVDDTATKELMVKFYKNMLEKNLDKAEALRQAKLELIKNKKYTSPLFWSAFVLYGE